MKKNSTPSSGNTDTDLSSRMLSLTYIDGPLFEPAGPQPRRSTIERIRQFARAACIAQPMPEMAIVLN